MLEAYHDFLEGKEAPIIDGLSGDQRLFLGYAQMYSGKMCDDAMLRYVLTDAHSPQKFRVNSIVRNIDGWYEAFAIHPSYKLFLSPEERVMIC